MISTETIFSLLSDYGPIVVFVSAFLSCLALPIPTSLMMLAGGAFAASGDLALGNVILAAFLGAIIGDQAGYLIGRIAGVAVLGKLRQNPARKVVVGKAQALIDQRGGIGVFFSTWAVAPLGPWVNFVAGATKLGWLRFAFWDILGETVWVTLYVGLGYGFASRIESLATLLSNVAGLLVTLAIAAIMFIWIRAILRAQDHQKASKKKTTPA